MRSSKLRLDLDRLVVESFDTSAARAEKGTVFGEQCTCHTNCTCPGCPTCDYTACGEFTCAESCDGTCDESCRTCHNSCHVSCIGTCGFTCDAMECQSAAYHTGCC